MHCDSVARVETSAQFENLGVLLNGLGSPCRQGDIYERSALVATIVALLQAGRSVLLRGESGVGKTALARSLAWAHWPSSSQGQLRLIRAGVPTAPPILETSAARFVDGCYYAHNLENKMRLAAEAIQRHSAILFIDNVQECVGCGSSGEDPQNDVANLLIPHMDSGLRILGAVTPEGEARILTLNGRLHSRFVIVDVPAPDDEESEDIAKALVDRLIERGEIINAGMSSVGLRLARRYMSAETPVAAFSRIIERACAVEAPVDERSLRRAVSAELNVLPTFVGVGHPPTHAGLRSGLEAQVFGQGEATSAIADALVSYAVGLNMIGRPIGAFLFVGPSGCGKTSLALAAAAELTGSERNVLRFDMSEYSTPPSVRRLIDGSSGSLTSRLMAMRGGVLLLDEIEKADPAIHMLLLQAVGEGRLTNEAGRTVRLDNHIVILTSNLGSRRWTLGKTSGETARGVLADCANAFPPELRARLTRTMVFQPLEGPARLQIAQRALGELNDLPGLVDRDIQLIWGDSLLMLIAGIGFSRAKGARGMQVAVRELVHAPLSRWLAQNPGLHDGIVWLVPRERDGDLISISVDWVQESAMGATLQ